MSTGKKAYMDTFRKCAQEGEPEITVGPDQDALGLVRIFAERADDKEYWGAIDFCVPPELARKIAQAMIFCADEAEGK